MENNTRKTPQEVSRAVKADWASKGISITAAAARIGSQQASLSAVLARATYIGANIANRLSDAFGYDTNFLLTGRGQLFGTAAGAPSGAAPSDVPQGRDDLSLRALAVAVEALREGFATLNSRVEKLENLRGGGHIIDFQPLTQSVAVIFLKNPIFGAPSGRAFRYAILSFTARKTPEKRLARS